ncbi:MAG: pentapeptide repeat-containing protein [Nostoc sp. ChiQUE02]|uniref:pentapeptide repeat-containing protein n=1 Tax=Nostoc sp. ChiQUE02 TaxID=3075377 RepID=UPI002AD40F43|nr:pentapeptide repeat-containing protein [Nostoc sp. ChiQUE02]MDZ8231985.1 pentapeptide repeat-containing protein [Nostoc sp. ChiQUE02]
MTATLYLPPVRTILSGSNLTGANMREAKFLNANPKRILSIALTSCDNLRIVVNDVTIVIRIEQIHTLLA